MSPGAATEPWRSTRRRRKSAALMEAEADAAHERIKRQRRAAATARRREANVCAEEPDTDELAEEESAALEAEEAEEQAMVGAGSEETVLCARRGVSRPSATTEKMASDGASWEDHFVGEPVPDDEARRRWPARYRAKDPDSSNTKRSDFQGGISARCHYRTACVDGAHYDLGDDVCLKEKADYAKKINRLVRATGVRATG